MSKVEFADVMTWISVAIGKPIADDARQLSARMDVYFECLGDLPLQALQVAARRCAIERKYQSFPPIAELREMAVETQQGAVKVMTGEEAFAIALRTVDGIDVECKDRTEATMAKLDPTIRAAIYAFGFDQLYTLRNEAIGTARAQFVKCFNAIAERERKTGILPAAVQKQIVAISRIEEAKALPVVKALAAIGVG